MAEKQGITFYICLLVTFLNVIVSHSYYDIPRCLRVCRCDDTILRINCSSTGMEELPSHLPNDYHSLYVDNNFFKVLNESTFNLSSLPHLRELSIVQSNIITVQNGTFQQLSNLVSLDMRNNFLGSVPYGISGMTNLQTLDLSGNQIESIPPEMFPFHGRLQTLFFDRNRVDVTSIEPGTFSSLVKLRKLSISLSLRDYYDSAAYNLDYRWHGSAPSEYDEYSLVQDNEIVRCVNVSLWFDPMVEGLSMVSLSLSTCEIKCLSEGSLNNWFSKLQILDLSNNVLDTLPDDTFRYLENLEEFYVESNRLRYIPDNVFSPLSSLRILNLKGNQLVYVSGYSLLPISGSLTYLDISFNGMETWNATSFAEFHNLKVLNIRSNFISDDKQLSFTNIPRLEILKLGGNKIKQFPNITHLKQLRTMMISDNLIRILPEHALKGCKKLRTLTLNGNRLRAIPKSVIVEANSLSVLETMNNPLACDCNIKWLSEGLIDSYEPPWPFQYDMIAKSTCSFPPFLKNHSLLSAFSEAPTDMICSHIPDTKSILLLVFIWVLILVFIVAVKLYPLCPVSRRHFHAIRLRESLLEEDPTLLNFLTKDKKLGKYRLVGETDEVSRDVPELWSHQSNQLVTPSKLRKVNWSKMPETQV